MKGVFLYPSGIFIKTNMANLNLDFVVVQTNNTTTMTIVDSSTYPNDPPNVSAPTIEITVPSFGTVSLPFAVNSYNIFNSASLGLSEVGNVEEIPDGVYFIKYSIAPAFENYVEHSIIRVDKLQEKFDQAFMTLDMMECDRAIKEQSFVTLNTIYLFIQGAVAAANNCATIEANNLYKQADNALDHFIRKDCGCSGTNRLINFN